MTSIGVFPPLISLAIIPISSAKIVLRIVFGPAIDCDEPTARNSNLFPVKANGDVLLRSVLSLEKSGTTDTPVWKRPVLMSSNSFPSTIASINLSSSSPKNIEIIAGGASLAPNL